MWVARGPRLCLAEVPHAPWQLSCQELCSGGRFFQSARAAFKTSAASGSRDELWAAVC